MHTRREMLDVVVVDGRARGIVVRNLITGAIERHSAHAVVLCTGGYSNVYFLSTNAMASNVTAAWRAPQGRGFANPCFTQIHPTCHPGPDEFQSKLTLMSESLRNDGRIWVPRNPTSPAGPRRSPNRARLLPGTQVPESSATWFPRDVASRNAKEQSTPARASDR